MAKRYSLYPRYAKAALRDFLDFDYLDKLSEAELDFLADFCRSFYRGDPAKTAWLKERLESYSANNRRQRDIFTVCVREPLAEDDEGNDQ